MKKTDHYKLNLIETTDTFSPAPLNENATLLEQALDAASAGTAAEAQARADADSTEAKTRAAADSAEAQARADADSAEVKARTAAINSEAQARAAAINSEAQTRAAADNALASRVTVLEARKLVPGTYTGTGTKAGDSQTISLGFTPAAVFVSNAHIGSGHVGAMAVTGYGVSNVLEIVSGGFKVYGYSTSGSYGGSATGANNSGIVYHYFALR